MQRLELRRGIWASCLAPSHNPTPFNHFLNRWPSGLYSSYWEGKEQIFDGGNGAGGAFLNQTNAHTVPAC